MRCNKKSPSNFPRSWRTLFHVVQLSMINVQIQAYYIPSLQRRVREGTTKTLNLKQSFAPHSFMRQKLASVFLLLCFWVSAQHQDKVDFISAEVSIEPIPLEKKIKGFVTYEFEVLQDVDSVFLDAKNMEFLAVQLNGKKIKYFNNGKIVSIRKSFRKGKDYKIKLTYSCTPKQTVYFLGWNDDVVGNEQIWTQGQGKYTSHWLPSFDDMNEKLEFDLSFISNLDKTIEIANGIIKKVKSNPNGETIVSFDMQNPMSSYLLAFAIGNYDKQQLTSSSGIAIENYYYPKDSSRVEPTYRYTAEIFDFLETEIGVPYPWQNYKQIPVRDFLYAGMENTSATIFSDGYVIDSTAFVDKNYVNVNAHELAHQWFGNLVTEKDSNHHWLHEGFATYYAYLSEKELFGDEHFYWKLYKSLTQLQSAVNRGEGQSLLDPKASSLTFYEKGAWALFILGDKIGDLAFKKGIKNYLEKYKFKNVTVSNFLLEMEKASDSDLSSFREDWLESTELPFNIAMERLAQKSTSLALLVSMENGFKIAESDDIDFERYWDLTESIHLKKHILDNHFKILPEELIEKAFDTDTIPLRQSLAIKMDSIPSSLKTKYESLLNDKSYITIESALFKLWASFPKDRKKYLYSTKNIDGLPNQNVKLLWLTLAILTNDYEAQNTQQYFIELSGYTSPKYSWETRMGAFQYVSEIGFNDQSLKNLINATVHHSWQFKKYAQNLMDKLLKDSDYQNRIEGIAKELKEDELRYMNTKLVKK